MFLNITNISFFRVAYLELTWTVRPSLTSDRKMPFSVRYVNPNKN